MSRLLVTRVQTWELKDADHLNEEDAEAMAMSLSHDTDETTVERLGAEEQADGYKG